MTVWHCWHTSAKIRPVVNKMHHEDTFYARTWQDNRRTLHIGWNTDMCTQKRSWSRICYLAWKQRARQCSWKLWYRRNEIRNDTLVLNWYEISSTAVFLKIVVDKKRIKESMHLFWSMKLSYLLRSWNIISCESLPLLISSSSMKHLSMSWKRRDIRSLMILNSSCVLLRTCA